MEKRILLTLTQFELDSLIDALVEWNEIVGPKELADDEVGLNSERYEELMKTLKGES